MLPHLCHQSGKGFFPPKTPLPPTACASGGTEQILRKSSAA